MPISSGATVSQAQGSYLKRYFSSLPQQKRKDLENTLEAACVSEENMEDPTKDVRTKSDGDAASDDQPSRKSSTCTVL